MACEEPSKIVNIPSIVQELVTCIHEPPSQYVVPEQNRPDVACSEMPEPIPIIDLSRLPAPGNSSDEVAKMQSRLGELGPLPEPSFLGDVMKVTREFYKLPLDEKQKYSNLVDGEEFLMEGYGNDIVVSEKQTLDWSDRLYLVVEPESRRIYSLWPTQPPSFRDIMCEYTVRCREIASLVLRHLAKMLDLHKDYFVEMIEEDAITYARLNYYPPCPKPNQVLGLKPHTDATVITVVFIDDSVSGLQVQKNGVWYKVPIVPNALLVNTGDVMEILSNGFFKSPVHRAVTNAEEDRVSLVMFYTTDPEREIGPVPELVDDKRPARYRKIKSKDYLRKLFETFAEGTLVIDTMKI
uniref:Protein SRG1 n=1 Tax=Aegilops tauschii TaxID=37682 RepID=R7W6M9_AEGTA